ncbi:MAG TPA: hypothetical protein VII76_07135 [Acidimicrobiales bacterium]
MRDQLLHDTEPHSAPRRAPASTFFARILAVYLLTRLVVFGVLLDAFGGRGTVTRFARIWDAKYYLQVAAHGYPTVLSARRPYAAFFPLYPLMVRVLAPVFDHDWVASGLAVSLLTGASACLAVGALARDRAGDETGVRAGWLVAVAPGAAFLSPAYADGLALALCAGALLMLDRRRWVAAGLLGGVATAASPLAVPIVIAAAWAAWRSGRRQAWLAPVLASSGFGSYCLYLWVHMGTPFGWFDAERVGWQGQHHFNLFSSVGWFTSWTGITLVETFSIGLAAAGLWAMRRARVPGTWWAFTIPFLASVVFDSALWLTPRILLTAVPLVPAAAIVLHGKRYRILLASSVVVMLLVLVVYVRFPGFVFQP